MYGPRNGMPKSCAVVVRLKPTQYAAVAAEAERDGRSMASVLRRLVDDRLELAVMTS